MNLGMNDAFDPGVADFTNIDGGVGHLYLGFVQHEAFIKVNEEGTEAAAATGAGMSGPSAPPPVINFIANHSFLFIIRDVETGTVLFMGRITNPTE